jgi:hypothetical protein
MKKPIDFNTVCDDDFDGGGISNMSREGDQLVSASQEEIRLSNIPQS